MRRSTIWGLLSILALIALSGCINPVDKPVQNGKGPLAVLVEVESDEERADAVESHKNLKVEDWRRNHMTFLKANDRKTYTDCFDCHDTPKTFCNSCHGYVGVTMITTGEEEESMSDHKAPKMSKKAKEAEEEDKEEEDEEEKDEEEKDEK